MSTTVDSSTNALLLLLLFQGKDFQAARKELEKLQGSAPSPAPLNAGPTPPSTLPVDQIQISSLSVTHLEAHVEMPQGSLQVEFTRVEAMRVTGSGARPHKQDPLLIDLGGDGPDTTGAQGAQVFDLAGSGQAAPTSFVQGSSAFLALDRNGNGRIDSGLELLGDQHGALDGYEELRKFDSDGNSRIDAADPVFSQLSLLHGNGHTESLTQAGIQAINLNASGSRITTSVGDDVLRSATATTAEGRRLNTYAMALQQFDRMA